MTPASVALFEGSHRHDQFNQDPRLTSALASLLHALLLFRQIKMEDYDDEYDDYDGEAYDQEDDVYDAPEGDDDDDGEGGMADQALALVSGGQDELDLNDAPVAGDGDDDDEEEGDDVSTRKE